VKTPLRTRIAAAWQFIRRGTGAFAEMGFNRVPFADGGSADRLRNPYSNSVWVQRAIKKVSGPISAVPLMFSLGAKGAAGEQAYNDPDLTAYWSKPTSGLTFASFIEATVGWLKLAGEYFWLLDDSFLAPFPEARTAWPPLIVARPDRMRHVIDHGQLVGWVFTDGQGQRHTLLPQQVIHLKTWNPYNDWRGLSEMEAAEVAAEADYLAGKFNLHLMRSNGDRGPYIVAKGGIPDDTQRQMIISQLREKKERSLQGEFRPVFLSGDITVEDPQIQAMDANVIASRLQNRHEIFIGFGVPPSMADVVASYSIGSASDRFILIEETCIPVSVAIASSVKEVVEKQTGKPLTAWFDWDEHSVMQQVRRERIDAAQKLWAMGQPMEHINDYLRLGMKPYSSWDVGYLPFSVAPVGEATPETDAQFAEPTTPPGNGNGNGNGQAVSEMLRAITAKRLGWVGDSHRRDACATHPPGSTGVPPVTRTTEPDDFQSSRPARELAQWRDLMSKRRVTLKAYERRFNRELMKARAETLSKLEKFQRRRAPASVAGTDPSSHSPGNGLRTEAAPTLTVVGPTGQVRAAAVDFIFDLSRFSEGLITSMRPVAAQALHSAGQQLFDELAKDDPFKMTPEAVLQFNRQRENRLKDVPTEIHDQVKQTLEDGLQLGESIDKLSDRVRAEFNDISRARARTIAMTETSAAYGQGRAVAMKQAGVQYKKWLTSGNDNVRPAHAAANGQVVGVDEAFEVGGEHLRFPGDPDGSAGNVINCHCVSIAVAAPPEET
jgi:SPP1 gp7 family putative phage head morphogenesis protein